MTNSVSDIEKEEIKKQQIEKLKALIEKIKSIPKEIWNEVQQECRHKKKLMYRWSSKRDKRKWVISRALELFDKKED